MTVTIKDVAKYANVAPSTVSRVISDHPKISEETKRKVRQAMKELGYHPNLIARSLANKATKVIGLVMPDSADVSFQNPFFPTVLQGISESAYEKTYAIQLTTGRTQDEIFQEVKQMVQGRRVDGLILLNSHVEDRLMAYLMKNKFPFVVVGKPYKKPDEITHIDNDNVGAAKEATNYLIERNHRRIAFIGGDPELVVTVDRLDGYKQALQEAGIERRNSYIVHGEFLEKGGQEAIAALMKVEEPPTALVVTDDFMTLGVLQSLDKLGISVPDEMSIVSFNNVYVAQMTQLTTVDIHILRLGYEAAKSLIEKVENPDEPIKRIIIPHELVERGSCAILASTNE